MLNQDSILLNGMSRANFQNKDHTLFFGLYMNKR